MALLILIWLAWSQFSHTIYTIPLTTTLHPSTPTLTHLTKLLFLNHLSFPLSMRTWEEIADRTHCHRDICQITQLLFLLSWVFSHTLLKIQTELVDWDKLYIPHFMREGIEIQFPSPETSLPIMCTHLLQILIAEMLTTCATRDTSLIQKINKSEGKDVTLNHMFMRLRI